MEIFFGLIACFFGWYYFTEAREMGKRMEIQMGEYNPELENYRAECYAILSIDMLFSVFGWVVGSHLILREIELYLGAFA